MKINEAQEIFKSWQDYMEIADKFHRLMLPIPESFLPYPADVLEEALHIILKYYFDSGDKKMSENIQETMCAYLLPRRTDEEAITEMKKMLDLIEKEPKLKKDLLKSLKEGQEFWIRSRKK